MKKNAIIFNILTVIAYFYGLFLCATIIAIPLGVYAVISAHRYSYFADLSPVNLAMRKSQVTNWIIFGAVLYFPFGLIGLLILSSISNNVSVTDVQDNSTFQAQSSASQDAASTIKPEQPTTEVEIDNPISEEEKAEKLEKLKRFKENGLITAEEYDQAVSQLYDGDKK